MLSVSRIAFNPNRSRALVNTYHACGNSCVNRDTWFLTRSGKTWQIAERIPGEQQPTVEVEPMRYLGVCPIAYRPRRVQGVVRDAGSGKAAAGFTIRVRRLLNSGVTIDDPSVRTDSLGRFTLIGCGIKTISRLFYFAPLLVLGGTHYLSVFSGEQLNAVALLSLRVNDIGAGIALVFFGFYAILKGYLVIRSMFLPRVLGWLAVLGGIGWLAYLSPPFGDSVFSFIALFGIVGALANIVWLLVVGVNEQRWREQASLAEASIWR